MTAPTLNRTGLETLHTFLGTHADVVNQATWGEVAADEVLALPEALDCGTVACSAGWTCLLNGDRITTRTAVFPMFPVSSGYTSYTRATLYTVTDSLGAVVAKDDDPHDIVAVGRRAQEILGLTTEQADALFLSSRTLAGALETINRILDGDL